MLSTHARATIESIDASAALALEGRLEESECEWHLVHWGLWVLWWINVLHNLRATSCAALLSDVETADIPSGACNSLVPSVVARHVLSMFQHAVLQTMPYEPCHISAQVTDT